ncbi:hypothetical protein HCN44_000333 [Aphidius gifuensis]|uniref:Uncharacterized protein n=1 Tax=Aphidius gifuensis TaxID=684658 RepID=A0A835CQT1_APHGI|nr:hypothetical protein HCN44_000333 [Aphidius gifuensis]
MPANHVKRSIEDEQEFQTLRRLRNNVAPRKRTQKIALLSSSTKYNIEDVQEFHIGEMNCNPGKIIQAVTCLHNYLQIPDIGVDEYGPESMLDQDERAASPTNITAFQDVTKFSTNYASEDAKKIRSEYCRYFNQEGAVPWQYDHC